ncbi:MAG: hypothetical protein FJ271_13270 [Planctomycetes bacterium]|nr:hypothetical protein [Planctomycetota bacterium]
MGVFINRAWATIGREVFTLLPGDSVMARKPKQHPDYVTCKHCRRDFRAITVWHLRRIHEYDGDHPIEDYKRLFRLQTASCREVRKKISEAKEIFWARRGQHWTPARLIAEIRRTHRAGRSLKKEQVPVRLYEAGRRYFGSWQKAVEKAGLDFEKATGVFHWTRDRVVQAIQRLAQRGVPLSATYVAAHEPKLFNVAVKRFPRSWAKALRAAGFNPDEHKMPRGRWSRENAEEWVRKRHAKGKALLRKDAPRDLAEYVQRRLGKGWTDFVESLGIQYPGVKKRRDWTRKKLLEEIRRWGAEGHRLNYRAVASEYQALIHQARKYLGSWDRTLAAAGVARRSRRPVSEDVV